MSYRLACSRSATTVAFQKNNNKIHQMFDFCSSLFFSFVYYYFWSLCLFDKTKYERSGSSTMKKRGNLKNDAIRRHYILRSSPVTSSIILCFFPFVFQLYYFVVRFFSRTRSSGFNRIVTAIDFSRHLLLFWPLFFKWAFFNCDRCSLFVFSRLVVSDAFI